jgi:hypothetical protein
MRKKLKFFLVLWGPRVLPYTVAFKDKIWIIGGQTMTQYVSGKETFYNDVWKLKRVNKKH